MEIAAAVLRKNILLSYYRYIDVSQILSFSFTGKCVGCFRLKELTGANKLYLWLTEDGVSLISHTPIHHRSLRQPKPSLFRGYVGRFVAAQMGELFECTSFSSAHVCLANIYNLIFPGFSRVESNGHRKGTKTKSYNMSLFFPVSNDQHKMNLAILFIKIPFFIQVSPIISRTVWPMSLMLTYIQDTVHLSDVFSTCASQ